MSETNEKSVPVKRNRLGMILVLAVIAVIGTVMQGRGYQPAVWEGDTIASSFLGIQFTLPEQWEKVLDEQEIRAVEEQSKVRERYCQFMARSDDGASSIALLVEKTDITPDERMESLAGEGDERLEALVVAGAPFQVLRSSGGTEDAYTLCCTAQGYLVSILIHVPSGEDIQSLLGCFAPYTPEKK